VNYNALLKKHRKISFEQVIEILREKGPLDVVDHPNREKYANQRIYVVSINQYVYLVPFVQTVNKVFLKTIFPSRKASTQYLMNNENKQYEEN
jgi:hypothetical protein